MLKKKGFTLVEVILVVVLIGILAAIVIPRITYTRVQAENAACNATVSMLNSQIEYYYVERSVWPTNYSQLVPNYIDEAPATCARGTAYVYCATTRRVLKHAH